MVYVVRSIEAALAPLGMLWIILVAASVWLARRRQRKQALGLGALAASMFLVGSTPLSALLLSSLERPYTKCDFAALPKADAVVVLGGMLDPSQNDVLKLDARDPIDRALTGVELIRQGKGRALVLGGPGPKPGKSGFSEGQIISSWFETWGLTNTPILLLGSCSNTRDEALRTQALAQRQRWERIVLVTSAWHMKRSEAAFRRVGLKVTCAPSDFVGTNLMLQEGPFIIFPTAISFRMFEVYLHEQIGRLYYRFRGWT